MTSLFGPDEPTAMDAAFRKAAEEQGAPTDQDELDFVRSLFGTPSEADRAIENSTTTPEETS